MDETKKFTEALRQLDQIRDLLLESQRGEVEQRVHTVLDMSGRQENEDVKRLNESIWPEIFKQEPLASWKGTIEKSAHDPDSEASLLLSCIHRYNIAVNRKNPTLDLVQKSLYELFQQAYLFWGQLKMSEQEKCATAQEWQQQIEPTIPKIDDGNFMIRIVQPGEPKDPSWMIYSPSMKPVEKVLSASILFRQMPRQKAWVE